jgi:hypothetical protein
MTLTIENGSGVSGADSFATVAECTDFAVKYFGTDLTGDTAAKEAALRRAFYYMRGLRWKDGVWPTFGGAIPLEVKQAQVIFAKTENAKQGVLSPRVKLGGAKTLTGLDVMKWESNGPEATVENSRPVETGAFDFLKSYLIHNPASDNRVGLSGIMVA